MPDIVEWSIFFLLGFLGFALIWFFPKIFGIKEEDKKFMYLAYTIKVLGGGFFTFMYFFYFKVGDTFLYHQGASYLADIFWTDPDKYLQLLFTDPIQAQEVFPGLLYEVPYSKTTSFEEWFMVRILSVFSIISFNSYLIHTFLVSLVSLVGSWHFYKFFDREFPGNKWIAFTSTFLLPSAFFWSVGILKDTFVFAFLGIFMFQLNQIVSKEGRIRFFNYLILFFAGFMMYKLKSYVLIVLIPCTLYFLSNQFKNRIQNYLLRNLISPLLIVASIGGAYFLMQFISNTTEKYQTDQLMKRAEGFHTTHSETGSAYSLGEMEYTTWGVIKVMPAAINVTLFRPYPWESSSPIVLLSSLESLFFLILFLYILYTYRWKINFWVKQNSYFILFISYSLILGAVVGYTSFNFGVLMRYKLPMIPFYAFTLLFYAKNVKQFKLLR